MIRRIVFFFVFGTLLAAFSAPTMAAGPKSLGQFGYWSAYQMTEGNASACYMTITAKPPVKKGEKKTKRGDIVLMITQRPSEGALDVVSYAAGAKFKPASDVSVQIGGKKFDMFTQDDTAWSRDSATDRAIASALRTGQSATLTGTLASGAALADVVNLKGAGDAYYAIGKACGLDVAKPKAAVQKPAQTTPKVTQKSTKTPPKTVKKTH
ncbi:MAG: invasion associated locus B family protein [Bdellovibrionales bacterium]|jgi:hypothetical protein